MLSKRELVARNDRQVIELNRRDVDLETARRRVTEQATDIADLRMQLTAAHDLAERIAETYNLEVPKIRLEVLRQNNWADLEELERTLKWVLHGEITARPEPTPEDGGIKSDAREIEASVRIPVVAIDDLTPAIVDLSIAIAKLNALRNDPNLSIGKVRVQKAHARALSALQVLEQLVAVSR